jgi:hypothetical protein
MHRVTMLVARITLILLAFAVSATVVQAAPVVPAKIISVGPTADSIGYTTSSGTDVINAQVGRWDTPYPYPDTGRYAPGLEPSGFSSLAIDIDVNDGGLITFRYLLRTYDAGIWDWLDIYMETPTGRVPIVERLGKPGSVYGTYWESPSVAVSQSLDKWRYQRVRFVFRVAQDGWGDQSVGEIINFSVATCAVPRLTPLPPDPDTLSFEAGNTIRIDRLLMSTRLGLECMQNLTGSLGGNVTLNSAWRPLAYQAHLREVWDTWRQLKNNEAPECQALKNEVQADFLTHQLVGEPGAASPFSSHYTGLAIDVNIEPPLGWTAGSVGGACGMYRPWPQLDPVHFQPR